jgi:hypothetical protein
MPNQLINGTVNQGTTLGVIVANQLVTGGAKQRSSQACIIDLTPPTFSGISFLNLGVLGQLQLQWAAATDATAPVSYEVYVQAATASGLFNTTNIALVVSSLNADVFALANGDLIQGAVEYFVGVRAIDGVGNRDNNTVSLSQVSPGITGANLATISGIFSINETNQLIGSFWVTDSIGVISNPLRLGTASYVIYDKNGSLVPGMAQSGIAADAQGFYQIAPVASVLDLEYNLYSVKATITVDSVPIVYNLPITIAPDVPEYEPRAVFSINPLNQLEGTLWVTKSGERMNANIGTASFTIYDKDNNAVGISQSGLTANVNGFYKTTAVNAAVLSSLTHYTVSISIIANGQARLGSVGLTIAE